VDYQIIIYPVSIFKFKIHSLPLTLLRIFIKKKVGVLFQYHTLHILSSTEYWQFEDCYNDGSISTHVGPYFPIHLPYAVSKRIKLSLTLKYTKSPSPMT